jgi:hypothetical protein
MLRMFRTAALVEHCQVQGLRFAKPECVAGVIKEMIVAFPVTEDNQVTSIFHQPGQELPELFRAAIQLAGWH